MYPFQKGRGSIHISFKMVGLAPPSRHIIFYSTLPYCTILYSLGQKCRGHPYLSQEGGIDIPILSCYSTLHHAVLFYPALCHPFLQRWRWHSHLVQEGCFGLVVPLYKTMFSLSIYIYMYKYYTAINYIVLDSLLQR